MNREKCNTSCSASDIEMADKLYKNLKMGSQSVISLMPHVEDKNSSLKSDMTSQLDGYEELASKARQILIDGGEEPKEENIVTKMTAKMGIAMNTAMDSTPSHIAEMMIEGSNMAITDTIKLRHEYEGKKDPPSHAMSVADELVRFEEHNIEKMKQYL